MVGSGHFPPKVAARAHFNCVHVAKPTLLVSASGRAARVVRSLASFAFRASLICNRHNPARRREPAQDADGHQTLAPRL